MLETLGLKGQFNFVATRDLVENSKPDPEIYKLVLSKLKVKPAQCIVIEDSLTGIKAALAARLNCIAVPNDYTVSILNKTRLIEKKWIVNDLKDLDYVAEKMIKLYS